MTNEELVMRIRSGERECEVELWERIQKLLHMLINQYMLNKGMQITSAGIERQDLEQEAYLAMIDAIFAYNPLKRYKFNTYLTLQCRNHFDRLCGVRSKKRDSLNFSISIDTPISGQEKVDETLADIISDSENVEKDVIENIWKEQLHNALINSLSRLETIDRECIYSYYLKGETQVEISKKLGIEYDKIPYRIRVGFKALRTHDPRYSLHQYR